MALFSFFCGVASPIHTLGLGRPTTLALAEQNRDTQLLADERCAVTLEHTNVCASFENEGMSSLPGGLSLVFIQSLVPDGHKKKKKYSYPFWSQEKLFLNFLVLYCL